MALSFFLDYDVLRNKNTTEFDKCCAAHQILETLTQKHPNALGGQ